MTVTLTPNALKMSANSIPTAPAPIIASEAGTRSISSASSEEMTVVLLISLWVLKGAKTAEYKGVAQFFKFLASTDNQAWWAGVTGYLPLTNSAVKAMEASGHFQKNPNQRTAITQMQSGKTTPNSQGIRLGNFNSVRDSIEEQMENILSGKRTAKQ